MSSIQLDSEVAVMWQLCDVPCFCSPIVSQHTGETFLVVMASPSMHTFLGPKSSSQSVALFVWAGLTTKCSCAN